MLTKSLIKTENGLSLLDFILEQLEMFHTSKTGRRYSNLTRRKLTAAA